MKKPGKFTKKELEAMAHSEKLPCRLFGKDWDPTHGPEAWSLATHAATCLPRAKAKRIVGDVTEAWGRYCKRIMAFGSGSRAELERAFWDEVILPKLEGKFREAVRSGNGDFLRALAFCVENIRHDADAKPVTPLNTWISRLFITAQGSDGRKAVFQAHENKTSSELLEMYLADPDAGHAITLNEFTRELRREGVQWRKSPGGAPKRTPAFSTLK